MKMVEKVEDTEQGKKHKSYQVLQILADLILDQTDKDSLALKYLNTLPIGLTLQDLNGRIIYANETAANIHGYPYHEFIQSSIRRENIIAQVDQEKIAAIISNIEKKPFVHDLKIKGRRKDGTEIYLLFNAGLICDRNQQPAYCLVLIQDISEKVEMRQAEARERAMANALIKSAALLSSSLNLDDVLEKILELAEQVVPHDSANIMLIDGEVVHVVRARGYKTKAQHDFTMSVSTRVDDFPSMVRMINSGRPMCIPDTRKYPDWQTSTEFAWLLSYVGAPLRVKGQVIGVINLDSGKPDFFCDEDANRLQAFADLAATAISNANLYEALKDKAAESASLFRASTALLSASGDITVLARQITQTVHQDFSSAHVAILMVDEVSGNLVQIAQAGYPSVQTHPYDLKSENGLGLAAIKQKKPVYVTNVNQDARFIQDSQLTRSEFDIPFIVEGKAIGVLNLESPEIDGFDERSRKIILTYAKRAAMALENARLIERLQKHEFQMTLINRLTQISLETSDLKKMLIDQVNILYETLRPDGILVFCSNETLRKIITGYAVAADETVNTSLTKIISMPDFSQKLGNFSNFVATNDTYHKTLNNEELKNPFSAYILHPLYADGIHLGSAILGYVSPRNFNESEISFFEQVVDQIALAVAKNLSILNANTRAKESESLRVAASTLTSTLNLQDIFERILNTAVGAIPSAQNGLLFLFDQQKNIFNLRAQFGFSDANIFTIRIKGHEGMAGKVALEKKAQIFNNISSEKLISFSKQKLVLAKQKNWIVAPLILEDKIFGVIELCAMESDSFSENDLGVLVSFADTVTAAINNAQLHSEVQQIAITDILTGLYNRRGFEELGQREIHRSLRTSAPLSILLMDVDYLKQVNDEFGHSAGDYVIQKVADCCRSTFRQIDLVSRYGGDEFAILLPDTPLDHAREAAERLRRTIENRIVQIGETELHLSSSIGVAVFRPDLKTIDELFDKADKALYTAKKNGRNTIFWEE